MGKGRNRNKKGGQGSAYKDEIDPILVAAVARPNSSSNGGLIAKYVFEDSQEIESEGEQQEVESEDVSQTLGDEDSDCTPYVRHNAYEEESEGKDLEDESDTASRTLGDEDSVGTQGVCLNANKIDGTAPNVTANSMEVKRRVPYVSLFKDNRRPSLGSQLEQIETGDGPIPIKAEEVQDSWSPWKNCLVGYFGGRFPGKMALNQIVAGWKVPVKVHYHNSGWIMFQFQNSECQMKVLENSPYSIYGKPLFLKIMPQNFRFQNEGISCFPVWVQIHNLPMEYWNPRVFGKICTRIGKPIHMDKLTTDKERVSFARCLVEINMEKDPPQALKLKLTTGEVIEQAIVYENLPRFCKHCRIVGHLEAGCMKKINSKNRKGEANKTTEMLISDKLEQEAASVAAASQTALPSKDGPIAAKLKQGAANDTATRQPTHPSKGNQAEWVQVQAKLSNGRTASHPAIPELVNKFQALAESPENEVEQPQSQETDSAQPEVNPIKHLSKIGEDKESTQVKQAKPMKGQSEGRDNVTKEIPKKAEVHSQNSGKSEDQIRNNPNQLRGQKGGAVHGNQKASGELETTTQQSPKFQSGISVAEQQKITSRIIRRGPAARRVHRIPNTFLNGGS